MHSSRMCTVRCSGRLGGGVVSAQEGGGSAQGMGGVCQTPPTPCEQNDRQL